MLILQKNKQKLKRKKLKITSLILILILLLAGTLPVSMVGVNSVVWAAEAAEEPQVVYSGDIGAAAVLGNLVYTDVVGGNVWSREAIYEAGALGIVKVHDNITKRFGRTVPLTREEAIAIVCRAAGLEVEALQLGVDMNNVRRREDKKTDSSDVLYDGFLQLAFNEGLISAQDLADALNADQASLEADSFKRKGAAQRQEMAYWLAKALKIKPVAQQQELLHYTDWRSVDPDKLSYMEAILAQRIMNGSGSRINPKQSITREQGAQIIKNAEGAVLEANQYTKIYGAVEKITIVKDYSEGIAVSGKEITIRVSNGKTAAIVTLVPVKTGSGAKNESSGTLSAVQKKELIVYKDGRIGDSELLKTGDRLQFIVDNSNTIKYVDVVSNINNIRYIAAQIDSVDKINLIADVTHLFSMDYPDFKGIAEEASFKVPLNEKSSYRIAANAQITINGSKSALSDITNDATAIFTIDSNNIVKEIQCVDIGINSEERRIVRGIVEENNPDLGYITLYNENGSGTSGSNHATLRSYNYVDQNKTAIYRNHKPVNADSIQTGDTAYIKLNSDGDISSISAVDNYTFKYARVISKLPAEIIVEFEDGSQQLLATENNVIVVKNKMLAGIKALKDGDRVRLLLNDNGKTTDLKEITIQGDEHLISNIYKGTITKIDEMSGKISVAGLQTFSKGIWERAEHKAFTTIKIAETFNIYSDETVLDIESANKLLYLNEAYIAVEKSYGGEEKAVLLSYRNSLDTQMPTSKDSITGITSGSGSFTLLRENQKVGFSAGSIVVKYGRLVSGGSLANKDEAYLALNRDYSSGNYYASVVQVDEPKIDNSLTIFRGRINGIHEEKDFTVESFSLLQGTDWKFFNTPKTFNMTFSTRILNDEGILNVRDFKGYGEENYLNRTVYIVADGVNAVLVSTAPFGNGFMKGRVYAMDGKILDLRNVASYSPETYTWNSGSNTFASIDILKNSIIIKNGKIMNASDIKKGDDVRILKKEEGTKGEGAKKEGYIIFVE